MNSNDVWLAILVLTLVTVIGRSAFLFAPPAWHPRGALRRALGYAPIAALVAIMAPEVFRAWLGWQPGVGNLHWGLLLNARMISAMVLIVALKYARHEFLSLFGAGALFWLLVSIGL